VPIYDTFTKRKRRAARAGQPEVYTYDQLSNELRTQIAYIWRDAIGGYYEGSRFDYTDAPRSNQWWETIRDIAARERGVASLSAPNHNPQEQCVAALLSGNTDSALEIIELSFRLIDVVVRKLDPHWRQQEGLKQDPDDAIDELNGRFKEHGVGYRYHDGVLVRIDSELLHAEVTLPALTLLHTHGCEDALQEFMSAHDHHRKGETKDANVDALNALESTLKTICEKRKWKYAKGANGADLMKLVVRQGLIPAELQGQFEHLLKAMETGLPPVRHNYGGHGQGAEKVTVADHLAAYSLHLMAANIVLLIEAHQATA